MPDEPKQSKPDEPKQSKLDIFIARSLYPEAEAVFTSRYQSLKDLKGTCIVVLDTNTLVLPYLVGKDSLEQIKATYKALIDAKRLVIPAQVAREFAKLRPKKLAELYDKFSKRRDSQQRLDIGKYPLLADVPEYQQLLIQQDEINKLIDEYGKRLGKVLEHIENWFWNDPVSLVYQQLFDGAVIKQTSIADDEAKKDLERCIAHKIPPAYKDAPKPDGGVGDLLIWKTILEVGAKEKKSILFVSGDEKADWWYRSNNTALYPRYELVDEFRRVSEGQSFRIVKFSEFLDLFGADRPVVEEVREKEQPLEDLDVEILVLDAFERGSFKLRSLSGITRDTGIAKETCLKAILSLELDGVLGRKINKNGGVRWFIARRRVKA